MTLETPLFIQASTYTAEKTRTLIAAAFHPGALDAGDLLVTQRGAGANMTVDVAAGTVCIPGSSASRGSYLCRNTATVSKTIGAAPGAGDSRIDLIAAVVADAQYSGSDNEWTITVVAGTADPDPDVPATPSGGIALATVLVEDDTTSIVNGQITDVRTYARGAAYAAGLPPTAPDGQVVVIDGGRTRVRAGGTWHEVMMASKITYTEQDMDPQDLTGSLAVWGDPLDLGTPGQPVLVDVRLIGTTGSDPDVQIERYIEISEDGGTTWPTVSPDFGASNTVGDTISVGGKCITWSKRIDTDDQILVRVRGKATGGDASFGAVGDTLAALVIPVA